MEPFIDTHLKCIHKIYLHLNQGYISQSGIKRDQSLTSKWYELLESNRKVYLTTVVQSKSESECIRNI